MIRQLVHAFYERVRADALIGSIFDRHVNNWDQHLARMCDFWSSVVLMSGRYRGQPMAVHAPLPLEPEHFDRWLQLFAQTARALCPPRAAQCFTDRARRIADRLSPRRGRAVFHCSSGWRPSAAPPEARSRRSMSSRMLRRSSACSSSTARIDSNSRRVVTSFEPRYWTISR